MELVSADYSFGVRLGERALKLIRSQRKCCVLVSRFLVQTRDAHPEI